MNTIKNRQWAAGVLSLLLFALPAVAGPGEGLGGGPVLTDYAQRVQERESSTGTDETSEWETEEVTQKVGPSITVTGTPEFVEATMREFDVLRETEIGREIIREIEATGHSVGITETTDDNGYASGLDRDGVNILSDGTANYGSDGAIEFNPYRTGPAATLGHELLHAMHYAQGMRRPRIMSEGPYLGTKAEELATIGLGEFEDFALTENKLRDQINALEGENRQEQIFQQRTTHNGKPPMLDRDPADTAEQDTFEPDRSNPMQGAADKLNDLFGGGQ